MLDKFWSTVMEFHVYYNTYKNLKKVIYIDIRSFKDGL